MSIQSRTIGRLPVFFGPYLFNKAYKRMNRVTLFGSEFQAKVDIAASSTDPNPHAPASYNASAQTVTFNEAEWYIISNGTDAWLAAQKMEALDRKIDDTSAGINTRIDEIVDQYLKETENPEFVEVHIDNNEKVLYGVQTDGNFYFGAGVPNQVKDFVGSVVPGMDPSFSGVIYYGTNPDATANPSRSGNMSIAGVYQVSTTTGSHIYFFIPSSTPSFYATINGLEIPFIESSVTIGGQSYKKYESANTYDEATFNIVLA